MVRASDDTAARLRWETLDDERPQTELFARPDERIRHPEFRDLEFVHVRSKSIINEVPKVSRVPFRYTINVYRGCSHACSYCLAGSTPILMEDGRQKPLELLRPGDRVFGTVKWGSYRRYVVTDVVDHWRTVKQAYRVELADGTELVASGDHRFLTERGWKHVADSAAGRRARPHLTVNNSLLGTGVFAEPPKFDVDYERGYLCGMIRGDADLATYRYERSGRQSGDVHRFRLALADGDALDRTARYLADRGIECQRFVFHPGTDRRRRIDAIRTSARRHVDAIRDLVAWPECSSPEWSRGFLAGIFDAEGSYSRGVLRIVNSDPEILDRVCHGLEGFGFRHVVAPPKPNACRAVRLVGGLREALRFFHTVEPAISRKRTIPDGYALKSDSDLRVVSVKPLGIEMPMYDITTGTGDFIANGVVSHNCFARPTHEYLNLDAGRDFERVIVVKVNAVELLRKELSRPSWAGEHIAMGTNTDPYQRAEGRYQLTRGVIETLVSARNPFSILTKSALVLRDTDLLLEAQRRTDVGVSFSIGTLDTDVWRATEPATPHPGKRVEAIGALADAGIRPGVLIAPIIPGISDSREQLRETIAACLDAGARSVTPIVLHLRPGVKEQFMPWLTEHRPDLVARYRSLYRTSYAPKTEQRRITDLFHDLVAELGGPRPVRARDARRVEASGAPMSDSATPEAEQLRLV